MIWTLLPGAVFLADGCLKKKAEEELKENEQIPVCKGHIVLRKCHNRGVAGGGFADSTKKVEILTFFLLSGLWAAVRMQKSRALRSFRLRALRWR